MIFRFNHLVLKRNHFGKKSGFWVKDVSKHFCKISHFGMNWLGCFELKCQVFKFSLYGLSVRDALAKTELKTNLKTRFYARKRKNAFLLYWWSDTTVCLDDTTVSESPVGDDTTVCLYDTTVSYSPVRDDTTVCPVTPQLLFYYFWLILLCLVYFYMKMLNYVNISVLLFDIYFII